MVDDGYNHSELTCMCSDMKPYDYVYIMYTTYIYNFGDICGGKWNCTLKNILPLNGHMLSSCNQTQRELGAQDWHNSVCFEICGWIKAGFNGFLSVRNCRKGVFLFFLSRMIHWIVTMSPIHLNVLCTQTGCLHAERNHAHCRPC